MAQNPKISTTISHSAQSQSVDAISLLFIGQKTSAGTAIAGAITENINSVTESNNYFGRTSHLGGVVRNAFKVFELTGSYKPTIDVIALDDNGSGVDATGTIVFSGTATEAGVVTIYIDNKKDHAYSLSIAVGDTATEVGDALEALITADADANFTASNTTGTVTITAVNAGTVGNNILTESVGSVAGITTTVSQTYLGSGATDPTITNLFDVVTNAGKKYTYIIYPSTYTRSILTDFTEGQFATNDRMFGLQCVADTYANLNTLLDGLNFKTLGIFCNVLDSNNNPQIVENVDNINSYVGSVFGALLVVGSKLGIYSQNSLKRGGTYRAGIPFHNTPLIGFDPIATDRKISSAQSAELTNSGGIVLQNNKNNTTLLLSSVVTTYKTDTLGNSDLTFKYLNRYLCSVLSVEYMVNNLAAKYAQFGLTDELGVLPSNIALTNKDEIIATIKGYYFTLSDVNGDYRLLRGGDANLEEFEEALEASYTESLATGTINFSEALLSVVSQVRFINIDFFVNIN